MASALWQEWRGDVNLGARWQPTQQLNVLAVDGNGQILAASDRTTIIQSGSNFICARRIDALGHERRSAFAR